MSRVATLGHYQPVWDDRGQRVTGPDEDLITLAVAAGRLALDAENPPQRVVLVCAEPDYLDGAPLPVLLRGLDLAPEVPAELRVGGAPAVLDAVATAAPGTLVIGVTTGRGAAAGAAFVGDRGLLLEDRQSVTNSLPMRVRNIAEQSTRVYADGRVERELGWKPTVDTLAAGHDKPVVIGVDAKDAKRLGGRQPDGVPGGASAPIVALGVMAEQLEGGRLVAVDAAIGTAVTVSAVGEAVISRDVRPPVPASARSRVVGAELTIPFSMPSYERAVVEKLTLTASRCPQCGTDAYPRRERCITCGRMGDGDTFALPRSGEIYSTVTVYAPVPGVPTPRALAIVSLPPTTVRVLAVVTDAPADTAKIGGRGELVLRLVAVREGVPDYGYAFRPEVSA
jgi:uncharacterized protein